MNLKDFKDYVQENGCIVENNIIKNVINGRWTRVDESFDETQDLSTIHHTCVLGIAPPEDLEDLYDVYSGIYNREVLQA
ncbi:MAG TPA: hypothetical protein VGD40_10090 [Chryseosolibacter sp.]